MKLDLPSHYERAYVANAMRARSIRLRKLAQERSKSSVRAELEIEADYCEATAQKLDDAEDPASASERAPAQVDLRRDIDAVDAPTTKPNGG